MYPALYQGDQVRFVADMSKFVSSSDWTLVSIVQTRIKKYSLAMHFDIGHKCIPVRH
jgi:hypothetical protein